MTKNISKLGERHTFFKVDLFSLREREQAEDRKREEEGHREGDRGSEPGSVLTAERLMQGLNL